MKETAVWDQMTGQGGTMRVAVRNTVEWGRRLGSDDRAGGNDESGSEEYS